MSERCGWILPDGTFVTCAPWQHLQKAREIEFVIHARVKYEALHLSWDDPEGELLRKALADLGLVKVNDALIDADSINYQQLKKLQALFDLDEPRREIQFVGRLNLRMEVRLFLKLKNPDRLNMLASMA